MQFVITAHDGKDMLENRMRVQPRHLENMTRVNGKVICAGGILNEDGNPVGSVMVMEFAGRELLDEYLKNEPYIQEGVWEDVKVEALNVVIVNGEKVGK